MLDKIIKSEEKYTEYPIYITDDSFKILEKNQSAGILFPYIGIGEDLLSYFKPSPREAVRNFRKNGIPVTVTFTDKQSRSYSVMLYEASIHSEAFSICIAAASDKESEFRFYAKARLEIVHQTITELRKKIVTTRRKNTIAKAERRMEALLSYVYRIESIMLPLIGFDYIDYNNRHCFMATDMLRYVSDRFLAEMQDPEAKIEILPDDIYCDANNDYLLLLSSTMYYILMCFSKNKTIETSVSENDDFVIMTFRTECATRGMKSVRDMYSFEPLYQLNTPALFDLFFIRKITELNGWKINYSYVKSKHLLTMKVFLPKSSRTNVSSSSLITFGGGLFDELIGRMAQELSNGAIL